MIKNILKLSFFCAFVFAGRAFAGEKSLNCLLVSNGNYYDYLNLQYTGSTIRNLKIAEYHLIKDTKQQSDDKIGQSVFAVDVGNIEKRSNGTKELRVALQDYSDIRSWTIVFSEDSNEAAIVRTFKSSDGDNLLHVSSDELKCSK